MKARKLQQNLTYSEFKVYHTSRRNPYSMTTIYSEETKPQAHTHGRILQLPTTRLRSFTAGGFEGPWESHIRGSTDDPIQSKIPRKL